MQDTNHQITDIHDQVERFFDCDSSLKLRVELATTAAEYRLLGDLLAMMRISAGFTPSYNSTGE